MGSGRGLAGTYLLTQGFVSQTPVTPQTEGRTLWEASSLDTEGVIPATGPGIDCRPSRVPPVRPWEGVFCSLSFSFPICPMDPSRAGGRLEVSGAGTGHVFKEWRL